MYSTALNPTPTLGSFVVLQRHQTDGEASNGLRLCFGRPWLELAHQILGLEWLTADDAQAGVNAVHQTGQDRYDRSKVREVPRGPYPPEDGARVRTGVGFAG